MWDQWLQSMAQSSTASSTPNLDDGHHLHPRFSRLRAVLGLMEWWRWSLILAGLLSLLVGLTLLIKSGQANGVQASVPEGNKVTQITLSPGANSVSSGDFSTFSASLSATDATATDERVYVDVAGAVVNPGVQVLEKSARAGAAVAAAGGLSKQAHQLYLRKYFNAAAPIHDGQKIYIPFAGEDLVDSDKTVVGLDVIGANKDQSALVSINTATSKQLDALPGIGTVRAEQIIAGRPYERLEELEEKQILTAGIYSGLAGLIGL